MPSNLNELEEILYSGNVAFGEYGKVFENRFSQYIGASNTLVVSSFNMAMLIALTTLGLKRGDQVIASPMSCLASNQPFAVLGIDLIWADIDPSTGTLCPQSVREKVTNKTKAIFHNHYCGYIGYVDEINSIAKELGIFVIDDANEALGSRYKGELLGNVGSDVTVYSFQAVRFLNTIDGGAVSFKDSELYERALRARDQGIDRKAFRDPNGEISSSCDVKEVGFGALMSDVNSYIGIKQLDSLDELLIKHKNNAADWRKELAKKYPEIVEIENCNTESNYWVFGVLVKEKMATLANFRKKGFWASGVHLSNSHYSIFGRQEALPGVEHFSSRFLALPTGWWFSKKSFPL